MKPYGDVMAVTALVAGCFETNEEALRRVEAIIELPDPPEGASAAKRALVADTKGWAVAVRDRLQGS